MSDDDRNPLPGTWAVFEFNLYVDEFDSHRFNTPFGENGFVKKITIKLVDDPDVPYTDLFDEAWEQANDEARDELGHRYYSIEEA